MAPLGDHYNALEFSPTFFTQESISVYFLNAVYLVKKEDIATRTLCAVCAHTLLVDTAASNRACTPFDV